MSLNHSNIIAPHDLSDLRNNLSDKIRKIKEFDQMLINISNKYDMEVKRST